MSRQLVIDGETLTFRDAAAAALSVDTTVQLPSEARERIAATRRCLEQWLVPGAPSVYGLNTGLGPLKDETVGPALEEEFQYRILLSHSTAPGEPWSEEVVRLAMLLRANVWARGMSGVRLELVERLLDLFNVGVTPVIGSEGSQGLGDLPPMAQVGMVVAGMPQGRARWRGMEGPAPDILRRAGLPPQFPLKAREALSLMSGSTLTLAAAVVGLVRAEQLLAAADLAAALTMEALRAETAALDPRVHGARPHPGQAVAAAHIRELLAGSQWVTPAARARLGEVRPRVQDAISVRCTPQVHGAVRDTWEFVAGVLQRDINASTDNPLFFHEMEGLCVPVSGGNSHAAPIGYAVDFIAIALADLAVLSDRRAFRLLDPRLSYGLPANLVGGDPGLNSGYAVAQASATALLAELRGLAVPASGGSVPTKSDQEDHVSMATYGARKLLRALELAQWVIAAEILLACQAIHLLWPQLGDVPLGQGTGRAYQAVRDQCGIGRNGYILDQWQAVRRLVAGAAGPDLSQGVVGGNSGSLDMGLATGVADRRVLQGGVAL